MDQYRLSGLRGSYVLDPNSVREGGQALVYRASFEGRRLAVKVARRVGPHIARERDALAKLRDKHADAGEWVVELVDSGQTHDGRDFIVLNWYSCSLEEWLEKPHTFAERLWVLEQCAEVVTRLHRAAGLREQYLHRDIKPGNFLIDENESPPRVVLADLGGVKDGRMLATTQFEGLHSPGFAPAEQGLPLAQRPDPSLDVHGLAATIYAGLCGRLPDAKMVPIRLGPDARRLMFLHLTGVAKRDGAEEKEYATLSRQPAEHFLDLDDLKALTEADSARLINHFRDELAAIGGSGAAEIAGPLLSELRAGLEADPRLRSRDPRRLYAAMVDVREAVEAATAAAVASDASGKGETWSAVASARDASLANDSSSANSGAAGRQFGSGPAGAVAAVKRRSPLNVTTTPTPPDAEVPFPAGVAKAAAVALLPAEDFPSEMLVLPELAPVDPASEAPTQIWPAPPARPANLPPRTVVSPREPWPSTIVPSPDERGARRVLPWVAAVIGFGVVVVVVAALVGVVGVWGFGSGGAKTALIVEKPPVLPEPPGDSPLPERDQPDALPEKDPTKDKGSTPEVVNGPGEGVVPTPDGKTGEVVVPKPKIVTPMEVVPVAVAPAPKPGDGARVRVVNEWTHNYPEVTVRLDHATSFRLSPTNKVVAFDVPNGSHTVTLYNAETGKAVPRCSWELNVSSFEGKNDEVVIKGGTALGVADGTPVELACKEP